jgi:hypothetical protein
VLIDLDKQSRTCRWDQNWNLACDKDIAWRFWMLLEPRLGTEWGGEGKLSEQNTICPRLYKRDGGRAGTLNITDFECKCSIIAEGRG